MDHKDLTFTTYIFPMHDVCIDADLSSLHLNNQILYADVLAPLKKGRTWYGLNYAWPDFFADRHPIPSGFDTYVFSNHHENWDNGWLDRFCQSHPNQQVVMIGEFDETPIHANLKILVWNYLYLYVPYLLDTFGEGCAFSRHRRYRLSSLCNKPSYLKALVTAYLLKNYYPRDNLLLSWNINAENEYCGSLDYLIQEEFLGRPILADLCSYYHDHMRDLVIKLDDFIADAWHHCNFQHPAFTDSLVNLTNETWAQNQVIDRKMPGPYFSEKTWKTIMGGSGLLPISQSGTYTYLESFGFCMDWPWPKDFDSVVGDLDRIEKVFDAIDWVLSDACLDYHDSIMDVSAFNFEHVRSQHLVDLVKTKNHQSLQSFLQHY